LLRGCFANNVGNQAKAQAGASTRAITKYYYFGGQRVAMRGDNGEVAWLHGDHLGSTSLATSEGPNPTAISRQSYYPFGERRGASAELPTDFRFIDQRNQSYNDINDISTRL
jgi:hypothetical protein